MMSQNNPELRIRKNAFSADIDHTVMTGGTIDVRKVVEVLRADSVMHPQVVLFPFEISSGKTPDHKAMHTLEHGLAYTGGLRDEIVALTNGKMDRNTLLDISPYVHQDGRLGFRVLSLASLDPSLFHTATENALRSYGNYLRSGAEIPFANQRQCGQYQFHDRLHAQYMIEEGKGHLEFFTPESLRFSPHIAVADLRLLKPQIENADSQRFLSPEVSYAVSQKLESTFGDSWQTLGFGQPPQLFIGTYGCMTGMYVVAESSKDDSEEAIFKHQLHTALTRSLADIQRTTQDTPTFMECQLALDLIRTYSPKVSLDALE